jgi:hypothetical protein
MSGVAAKFYLHDGTVFCTMTVQLLYHDGKWFSLWVRVLGDFGVYFYGV